MKRTAHILFWIPALLVLSVFAIVQLNDGRVPVGWKQNTDSEECYKALNDRRHCSVAPEGQENAIQFGCTDDAFYTGEPYNYIQTDQGNCITEYNIFANVLNAMTGFFTLFYLLFGAGWLLRKLMRVVRE